MIRDILIIGGSLLAILLIGILVGVAVMYTANTLVRQKDADGWEARDKAEVVLKHVGFSREAVNEILAEIDRSGVKLQLKGRRDA